MRTTHGAGTKYRAATRDFDTRRAVWGPATGTTLDAAGFVLPDRYAPLYTDGQARPQPLLDYAGFAHYFAACPTRFVLNAAQTVLNERRSDYVVNEKVMTAYARLRHTGDRHSIIVGVRYEDTETGIDGFRVAGVALTPSTRGSQYRDWLPSATFHYDLAEPLRLRLGYCRAIGRHSPSDLGTNETLNQTTLTLSRGNPDLRPRSAENFDASLEHYLPGDMGLVSVATFDEDIRDDIHARAAGSTVVDGATYPVTQPQNLAGSRVFGVEGAVVVNKLRFLRGALADFGTSLNATYLDGRADFPGGGSFGRPTQPPRFHQRDGLQGRISFSHVGRVQFIGEIRNVTDAHRENFDGYGTRDQNFFGRRFWLGTAVKP